MKQIATCILWLCLALSARAQGVFEASLEFDGLGLVENHFWFKVENNEVDFVAFVSLPYVLTPGTLDSVTLLGSLDPVLSVPGSSVEFSLGEPQFSGITAPARNPFLPPGPPLEPAGYDCEGNPYYLNLVSTPGGFYSGHFDLPPGFLDELLAGNGRIEINSSIGGNISVTPTPEPTTLVLAMLASGSLMLMRWRKAYRRPHAAYFKNNHSMKKIIIPCLIGLCLALSAQAQGVFQASLGTPPGDGGAQLFLGNFWFQVENDEVDFVAFVSPSTFTSSLNPILSVPGNSVGFSLGEVQTGIIGSQTDPNWNPFLPPKPLVPAGYDCDGNPVYITAPVILAGNFYTGKFALPPGFLDELLAGNGKIELNSSLGGNIFVTPTPEPTTFALGLMGIGGLLLVRRRKRIIR